MKTLILILFLIPTLLFGASLQEEAYKQACNDVNIVIEYNNKNDHPKIDEYLLRVNTPKGNSYCAAGIYYWYDEGSKIAGVKNPLYKTASAQQIYYNALKNPMRFKIIKPRLVRLGSEKLELGDIMVWKTDDQGHGHVGFSIKQNKTIRTVEPNTSSSNIAIEQREQTSKSKSKGGVYYKDRWLGDSTGFVWMGGVRLR